jgi:DNA-binding transcriptional MerR regulator
MRIGELASRSGVSTKTIRYYEGIGLFLPPRRSASGYRDYDEPALDRLAFVRAAQAVGLSLGEIRDILALRDSGNTPCGHVLDLLRSRSAGLDRRIAGAALAPGRAPIPRVTRVLKRATRAARPGLASPTHLLLALIRGNEPACEILTEVGLDLDTLAEHAQRWIDDGPVGERAS